MSVEKSKNFNDDPEFSESIIDDVYKSLPKTLITLLGRETFEKLCEKILYEINNIKISHAEDSHYIRDNFLCISNNEFIKRICSLLSNKPSDIEKLRKILSLRKEYALQLKNVIDTKQYKF